jgi:membrane protease YdiL (CAAX protease family)
MLHNESKPFREKVKSVFTSRFFIFETILISGFIMWWFGGPGYLTGLAIALITLWAIKWDWSWFGLGQAKWRSSLVPAIGFTIIIFLLNDFLIEPLTEIMANKDVDLSSFDGMRGNVLNLTMMLIIMWVMAAFGEEFFYRGYIMKRVADILGNNNRRWIIGAIISSFLFGLTHAYQGYSGMITTGVVGFILAMAFYRNRSNLAVSILTHGIYNTLGILLIYFEKERVIKDIMIEIYKSFIN